MIPTFFGTTLLVFVILQSVPSGPFEQAVLQIKLAKMGDVNENGILVANNNGGNSVAVAEHTIALMLSVYRKLPRQFSDLKSGNWSGNSSMILPTSHDLSGQKIGIIGFGHIGKKVARRLQGWECEISYNDIIKLDQTTEHDFNVRFESREDIIKSCDIIKTFVLTRPSFGQQRCCLKSSSC